MARRRVLGFVIGISLLAVGCSHTGSFAKRSRHPDGTNKNAHQLLQEKGRSSLPRFDIPMAVNDRVSAWLDFFQGSNHARFERYLERSGRYVSWMRGLLKEEGLPQDLVFLALIESGFSNNAYSRAKAVGPWQFIRATGVRYGLEHSGWVDERRDPEKATRAAARYLKKLYSDFGDWYLAMAAYNAGEGRIQQAIHASGSRDFWEISAPGTRYLKAETRDYVPKFLAAALIAKMPSRFGFKDVSYQEPFAHDEVRVNGPLDLDVASQLAGVRTDEIESLNPELNRFMTPPHSYRLRIPPGTKQKFEAAYAVLPPEKRMMMATHKVKKGETVAKLARRYGVSAKAIVAANGLKGEKARLKSGMSLMIPKGKAAQVFASTRGETHYYKVRRKDRLNKIANKFGVSVASVKKENHLKGNQLKVGQRLKITTIGSVREEVLLAYNKKSKRVHQNGVEWLIKQQQNGETVSNEEITDEGKAEVVDATENVAPEPVDVDPVPESNRETATATPPQVDETDLTEEGEVKNDQAQTTEDEQPQKMEIKQVTPRKHVVKKGDNLAKIAKKYGTTVAELKRLNNIKNDRTLRPGKTLILKSPKKVAKKVPVRQKAKSSRKVSKQTTQPVVDLSKQQEPAVRPLGSAATQNGQGY